MPKRIRASLLMVTVVALCGCERKAQPTEKKTPPTNEAKQSQPVPKTEPAGPDQSRAGEFSQTVTFRTTEKAPADFDAWTFTWIVPDRPNGAKLDYIVLKPDGEEYLQLDLTRAPPGQGTRSDFKPDFAGGDPAVFYGQYIKFRVRTTKGEMQFQNAEGFEFLFYRAADDGEIDWRAPFARIKAVMSEN